MQNLLGAEQSPYLLQHKDNPVWWYPWGDEAFARARSEGKPVFLSIGYSTCYWCHVMEKESFESTLVAEVLNRDFVCIKVDREERPDVDQLYMDVLVALSGHGGWPMSVFLTPEREPFWAGTYLPREQFLRLLEAIANTWRRREHEARASAAQILDALRERDESRKTRPPSERESIGSPGDFGEVIAKGLNVLRAQFDEVHGGFGGAPKFPTPPLLGFLLHVAGAPTLRAAFPEVASSARRMALTTLECMACGGIYDHIGGGFHRYATDEAWVVPHFEKMLYDNAQLVVHYLDAYRLTHAPFFADVARGVLRYMERELRSPVGGYYAAMDAGEVGHEGEFYVWSPEDLSDFSAGERKLLQSHFRITAQGNFERHRTVLTVPHVSAWSEAMRSPLKELVLRLYEIRETRKRPHQDTKVLLGWNGLALKALARAGALLDDGEYVAHAEKLASFLLSTFNDDGEWKRSMAGGAVRHRACLEDYVAVVEGLLELYRSSGNAQWLSAAERVQSAQDRALWSEREGLYQTSDAADLVRTPLQLFDGAQPCGNATALSNLVSLSVVASAPEQQALFLDRASALLKRLAIWAESHPAGSATILTELVAQYEGLPSVLIQNQAPCEAEGPFKGEFHRWACSTLPPYVRLKFIHVPETQAGAWALCRHGVCEPLAFDSAERRAEKLRF
jgi:uncharacterized protein YyaL (SSP411 family)